ncbi:MAG: branched-chain amino acid ABC transporter permease [Acidimicrobiia bacterium]
MTATRTLRARPEELSAGKAPPRRRTTTNRRLVARTIGFSLGGGLLLFLPVLTNWAGPAYAIDYGVIIAMVVLSAAVLGWIGEFSLAIVAMMGFGLVGINLLQDAQVPFVFIIPAVAVGSVPISLILGTFALRLRGVYFAIATLAFAYLAQKTVFETILGVQGGFGGTQSSPISRPEFANNDFRLYYLLLGSLLLLAGICWAINRSRIGTSLTALRESEMALSCLGHSPGAYKLFAICLSGGIAAIAGAYFGMLQGLVPANYFTPGLAILYFAYAVVGGLGSVGGAIGAGIFFGSIPKFVDTLAEGELVGYEPFLVGIALILVVLFEPGGLAAVGRRVWARIEGPPRAADVDVTDAALAAPAVDWAHTSEVTVGAGQP